MKCRENRRYLEAFLDGELDAEANLKVLEHLNLCAECNGTYDAEKALRSALRDRACSGRCPQELATQVCTALDGLDRAQRRRWIVPAASAVAAAVVAAVATAFLISPKMRAPDEQELAAFAAHFHDGLRGGGERFLCLRCETDPQKACAEFFGQRPAAPPCLRGLDGFSWRAAALAPVRGQLICWTVQECTESHTLVSHADLPSDAVRRRGAEGEWQRFEAGGRTVLMFTRGPRTCLFVTDSCESADRLMAAIRR